MTPRRFVNLKTEQPISLTLRDDHLLPLPSSLLRYTLIVMLKKVYIKIDYIYTSTIFFLSTIIQNDARYSVINLRFVIIRLWMM